MDALAELDRFKLEPTLRLQLSALVSSLIQQNSEQLAEKDSLLGQSAKLIAEKDAKIAALIHELAYYKRIRFGQKTEALAGLQRDLFREEVESTLLLSKQNWNRSRRHQGQLSRCHVPRVPAGNRCRSTCRVSNITMNPKAAVAGNAAAH
jgi:hypothetical protein